MRVTSISLSCLSLQLPNLSHAEVIVSCITCSNLRSQTSEASLKMKDHKTCHFCIMHFQAQHIADVYYFKMCVY